MAQFFLMPQASPTMESGRVLAWRKKEGDKLAPQDVVAEVETDKAAMEIEVFDPGVLLKILVPAGEEAKVDSPIAIIGKSADEDVSALLKEFAGAGGRPADAPKAEQPADAPKAGQPAAGISKGPDEPEQRAEPKAQEKQPKEPKGEPAEAGLKRPTWQGKPLDGSVLEMPEGFAVEGASSEAAAPVGRVRAAPAARRAAAELGVDLASVRGSGPHGRVLSEDVRQAAKGAQKGRSAPAAAQEGRSGAPAPAAAEAQAIPHSNMRKTIAKRLKESYLDAPTFFLNARLSCDAMVAFRGQLKAAGLDVSYNDILVKAAALALRDVPGVNASWGEAAITRHGVVNVGIAVAVEDGLITPVVRDADRKGLRQIGAETRDLAERARALKLKPDEYQGSTFTISNLGMMGIEHFTAIINPPNSCILAVGAMQQEPVVVGGVLGVGWRMKVTMTCDHRVVDGALGAQFLQALRKYVESPALLAG